MSKKEKNDSLEEQKKDGVKKSPEVSYEENDNWEFEATAHTLENTLVDNDEFEIILPDPPKKKAEPKKAEKEEKSKDEKDKDDKKTETKKSSEYETRERPKAEKTDKKPTKVKKQPSIRGKSNSNKILSGVLISLIVVVVLSFFGWRYYTEVNTEERMNYGNVVAQIGDEQISVGMFNYYYAYVENYYLSYAQQGYLTIDTTKPYSEQSPDEEFLKQRSDYKSGQKMTWADVFKADATQQMKQIMAFYNEGVKNGIGLTEEQKTELKEQVKGIKEAADESKLSVDEYLENNYTENFGIETFKKLYTQQLIAENYYHQFIVDSRPTDKEVEEYIKDKKDEYTTVDVGVLTMPYDADAAEREETEKQANKYAKQIKSIDDMKLLVPKASKKLIDQYVEMGQYPDAETGAVELAKDVENSVTVSDTAITEDAIKWLFDDSTKVGSVKVFTNSDTGFVYIIYKNSKARLIDDLRYTVRHILIMPESEDSEESDSQDTQTEKEYTKEEWAAAEKKAKEILAEYNKGEKTEIAFAELAEKNSDDVNSTSSGSMGGYGGLYQGQAEGANVKEFEEWSVDSARKYGDTGIVKTEFGYHIMFFIENVPYYHYQCESGIIQEKFTKLIDSYDINISDSVLKKTLYGKNEARDTATADTASADTAADSAEQYYEGE